MFGKCVLFRRRFSENLNIDKWADSFLRMIDIFQKVPVLTFVFLATIQLKCQSRQLMECVLLFEKKIFETKVTSPKL